VALVARNQGKLDGLVAQLAEDGIEAAGFPASTPKTGASGLRIAPDRRLGARFHDPSPSLSVTLTIDGLTLTSGLLGVVGGHAHRACAMVIRRHITPDLTRHNAANTDVPHQEDAA